MPLKVLCYNVWGIFVAKHVDVRMARIAEALQDYDVVCLQEQFEERHEKVLFGPTSAHKHRHRFVSAVYGSGLLVASRYPIVSTLFVPYRTHGHPERVWEGDYFANKGMALVRVAVPAGVLGPDAQEVCVVNTHLVPQYQRYSAVGGYGNERHGPCRLAQTYHLATLIASVAGGAPVVVCGDMNSGRQSPEQRLLMAVCARAGTPLAVALDDAEAHTFTTANSHVGDPTTYLNAFSMAEDLPVQLDHIYHTRDLVCRHGALAMHDRVDFGALGQMHMSDHFGVAATFEIVPGGKAAATEAVVSSSQQPQGDAALREAAGYLRLGAGTFTRHARIMQAIAALLVALPICFSPSSTATFFAGAAAAILLLLSHGHRTHDAQLFRQIAAELD